MAGEDDVILVPILTEVAWNWYCYPALVSTKSLPQLKDYSSLSLSSK